jgi:hypothetical protein
MTVPPSTWRLVADRASADEAFIPCTDPTRWLAIRQRMIDGPSEEEREDSRRRETKRRADMQALRERHEFLVKFADSPVVSSLLEQHAPHDCQVRFGYTIQECHGCPESHDAEYGESYQSWPCPTWQTISDATP